MAERSDILGQTIPEAAPIAISLIAFRRLSNCRPAGKCTTAELRGVLKEDMAKVHLSAGLSIAYPLCEHIIRCWTGRLSKSHSGVKVAELFWTKARNVLTFASICRRAACSASAVSVLLLASSLANAQTKREDAEHYNRAVRAVDQGNLSEAQGEIAKVLKDLPNQPNALNLAGIIYSLQGDQDRAITYFKKALSYQNDFIDARNNLAHAYLETNQYPKALLEFDRILKRAPEHPDANLGFAQSLYEVGRYQESLKSVTHALILTPAQPDALILLAKIEFKLGHTDEAMAASKRVQPLITGDSTRLESLGLLLLTNSCYMDAVPILQEAAEVQRRDTGVLNLLGLSYALSGQLSQAKIAFERSVADHPQQAEGHTLLGLFYEMEGQFPRSVEEFRAALAVDAQNVEANLHLGESLYKQGEQEEARRRFARVLELEPNRIDALYYEALIRIQRKEYQDATELLSHILKLDEKDLGANFQMAQALMKMGKKEEAVKYLKTFQDLQAANAQRDEKDFRLHTGLRDETSPFKPQ